MREQADVLLHGRRAEPAVAVRHGYQFKYPTMRAAFADVLGAR
jgi:NAD dependent epimerase/dehydratase family enzyme